MKVKQMTFVQARERIMKLENELDYLYILLNEKVRDDREIPLDRPPNSIWVVLDKERAVREQALKLLKSQLKQHEERTLLDFKSGTSEGEEGEKI